MEAVPREVALIILETIKENEGTIGVGKLALILKGSRSKLIKGKEARFKASVFWYPIGVIENFIRQLILKGFVETRERGFYPHLRPVLSLREEGRKAISENRGISLEMIRKKKEVKLNSSMKETMESFRKTSSVEETAKERGLAESTVWKHLTDLAALGAIGAEEVIPSEKLERISEARMKRNTLSEIKALLPDISYGEIRLALVGREKSFPQINPDTLPRKKLYPSFANPETWRDNIEEEISKQEWKDLRLKILKRDGYCCQYCGFRAEKWQIVHHMDGNPNNNDESNLETICPMCSLIHHAGHGCLVQEVADLYRESGYSQKDIIRITREMRGMGKSDREIISFLGLKREAEFRMDRGYLRRLFGFITSRKASQDSTQGALEYGYALSEKNRRLKLSSF
ncbi:MAG: helix-turn-helix domain-containing protein [Candidatus Woesearchaeota archaeon]